MLNLTSLREGSVAWAREPGIPYAVGATTNELFERLDTEREARRYFQELEKRIPPKTHSQPLTSTLVIKEGIELSEILKYLNGWTFKTGTFSFLNKPHENIEISSNSNNNDDQANLLIHLTGIKLPDNNEDLPLITVTNISNGKEYRLNLSVRKDFKGYAKLSPDDPIPKGEYRIKVKEKLNYNKFKGLFFMPEGRVRIRGKNIAVASFKNEELPPPSYEIALGKISYFLSEPFLSGSRIAFVLYLQGDETIYIRGAYKSLSHCCPWRIATHTINGWLGKGHKERDVALPIEIQSSIESILERKNWNIKERFELAKIPALHPSNDPTSSFVSRQTNGVNLGGFNNPADPSSFQFSDESFSPDFNRELEFFKSKSPLYGEVISYVFPSKDKSLLHLFNLATSGKNDPIGWYGDIQFFVSHTELDTYGIKLLLPVVPTRLFTPAHEHDSMVEEDQILLQFKTSRRDCYADISGFTNNLSPVKDFLNHMQRKNQS